MTPVTVARGRNIRSVTEREERILAYKKEWFIHRASECISSDTYETFIIVKKSKPLFKISSIDEDEGTWETVIDFTKIREGGILAEELLAKL